MFKRTESKSAAAGESQVPGQSPGRRRITYSLVAGALMAMTASAPPALAASAGDRVVIPAGSIRCRLVPRNPYTDPDGSIWARSILWADLELKGDGLIHLSASLPSCAEFNEKVGAGPVSAVIVKRVEEAQADHVSLTIEAQLDAMKSVILKGTAWRELPQTK